MKQVILTLNDEADLPALIKLFETFEGISRFEFVENAKEMSDEEYDQKFLELLKKSSTQIDKGKSQKLTTKNSKKILKNKK